MPNEVIQPDGWARAKGYANGMRTRDQHLYVGGQVGWNSDQVFESKSFIGQMEQALQATLGVTSGAKTSLATRSPFENVSRRRALIPLAAVAAVLVVVIAGWIALQNRTGPEAPQIAAEPPAAEAVATLWSV